MATCAVCGRPIVGGTVPVDSNVCINCEIRMSMPTEEQDRTDIVAAMRQVETMWDYLMSPPESREEFDRLAHPEPIQPTRTCFDCAGIGCDYCRHTGRIPA